MKIAASLLFATVALALVPAWAAESVEGQGAWGAVSLKAPAASNGEKPTISTDIKAATQPATAPSSAVMPVGSPSNPATAGFPTVPAAVPAAPAPAPTAASSPAPAALVGVGGLVPGLPAKTYETLADAAKDDVDPLGELKPAASFKPLPAQKTKAFDFTNPNSYVNWAIDNLGKKGLYTLGAGLLALLVIGFIRSRR